MKRVLVSVLCALCTLAAGAQSRQASFEAMLPDSVKYVLPAFAEGSLVYKDGGFSKGSFNISALDQTLRYIDTDGSEKFCPHTSKRWARLSPQRQGKLLTVS